jgi:hypothetical protein
MSVTLVAVLFVFALAFTLIVRWMMRQPQPYGAWPKCEKHCWHGIRGWETQKCCHCGKPREQIRSLVHGDKHPDGWVDEP